jgi:hypothetical protein
MTQISTFTVNDGADTPVAKTFTIGDRTGSKSTFRSGDAILVSGQKVFTHEARLAKTAAAANRVMVSMSNPAEATVDGSTKVVRNSSAKLELNYAPDANEDERQAFLGLFLNSLSQADIKASLIAVTTLS